MIRKRISVVVSLAAALAMMPNGSSQAATATFTFYGSGFGHGVGMSQWGAYGLAQKGWTHQQILTHYFSGTQVTQAAWEPAKVRVGLADSVGAVHLTAKTGTVTLRVNGPGKQAAVAATIPPGKTYTVSGGSGQFRVVDDTGTRVATVDGSSRLFVTY